MEAVQSSQDASAVVFQSSLSRQLQHFLVDEF
jgi:hypothetical protein